MKRIFSSKESLLSIVLAFSITSCSDIKSNMPNATVNKVESTTTKTGTLSINISKLLGSGKFGIKGNFNDNTITQLKVEVSATDIPETLIRNINWTGGSIAQTVNIDIPQGKNRVVSVTGVTATGKPVSRLMGVVNIYANTTSSITLNQGTTALARILNNILSSANKAVVDKVDIELLKRQLFNITGYRESDNTYFGVDPTKIDVFAISERIISNDGFIDPNNTTDLKNTLAFGNLKVYVKDKSGNPITGSFNLAVNDITGNTPVKVGNYNTIAVDQGVWEVSAKVYINSLGSTINVPLNQNEERNLILNGGGILYAKQTVVVKGTQEQEINLTLDNLKVKEIQLFKDERKLTSYETEINNPVDLDARVIYEDGSYSTDQVIWDFYNSDIATVTANGVVTGLKLGSISLRVTSILNKDKQQTFTVTFRDPGLKPVINSFTGGPTGTLTINGRNFDDQVPLNNKIKINGYKADVIEVTTDYIKVTIPNGGAVGSGRITVENLNGITTSDNIFYGNPIISTTGVVLGPQTFIMGSLNSFQMAGISEVLNQLNKESVVNTILATPSLYPAIVDMNTTVSSLTAPQIKAIALYLGLNETTLASDMANASVGTTLATFFYSSLPTTVTDLNVLVSALTPAEIATISQDIPGFDLDIADAVIAPAGTTLLNMLSTYESLARFFDGLLPSSITLSSNVSIFKPTSKQIVELTNGMNNTIATLFKASIARAIAKDLANTPKTNTTLGMFVSKYANIRVPSTYNYDYTERQITTLIKDLNALPKAIADIKEIQSPTVLASTLDEVALRKLANFTGLSYDVLQSDVNAIKTRDLNSSTSSKETVIQFLSRTKYRLQNKVFTLLNTIATIDPPLTSLTLVSQMTNSQIEFVANYIGVSKATLLNDIAYSPAGTTFNQLLSASKYHSAGVSGLDTTTTVGTALASANTLSYISQTAKISKDVLNLALPNLVAGNTVFNELTALKNYPSTNGIVYGPSEGPMVVVSVPTFTMDTAEVSNADFKAFMDADGYNKREYWNDAGWNWKINNNITQPLYWNDSKYNQNNDPVVGVSWYEAYAYAKWVGKRLPTEAEWEFAAKGAPSATYPWNNNLYPWWYTGNPNDGVKPDVNSNLVNGFFGVDGSLDGFKYVAPVGTLPAGNTVSGISNLSGNVMEWVSDWYDYSYYGRSNDFVNPQGPVNGTFKVVRGGSWTHSGDELRSSYRESYLKPESRNLNLGFRCVN